MKSEDLVKWLSDNVPVAVSFAGSTGVGHIENDGGD